MKTINIPIQITLNVINDILAIAIEGGINYWCSYYTGHSSGLPDLPENKVEIDYNWEHLTYGGENAYLTFYEDVSDRNSENFDSDGNYKWTDNQHVLKKDNLYQGIEKWIQKNPQTVEIIWEKRIQTLEMGNLDAGDCDQIIQYALFSELKYG